VCVCVCVCVYIILFPPVGSQPLRGITSICSLPRRCVFSVRVCSLIGMCVHCKPTKANQYEPVCSVRSTLMGVCVPCVFLVCVCACTRWVCVVRPGGQLLESPPMEEEDSLLNPSRAPVHHVRQSERVRASLSLLLSFTHSRTLARSLARVRVRSLPHPSSLPFPPSLTHSLTHSLSLARSLSM
jgi:hypothetical protein